MPASAALICHLVDARRYFKGFTILSFNLHMSYYYHYDYYHLTFVDEQIEA